MFQSLIIIISCILIEHVSRILLSDFIEITYNFGAAFGLLKSVPELTLILSIIACLIIFCVIIFAKLNKISKIGLSIMLGGAISNLIERIFFGHVIDWIPFLFWDLNFNLADVEISLGAFIAFVFSVLLH